MGLGLSASGGAISGTPTAVTNAAGYTVTASNAGGSTTTTIKLTVNDSPPAISYGGTAFAFTAQQPVHLTPTNRGGSVVTWSISPAPPAGLTFGTTDGSIDGTPTAAADAATYVVTARNSGGQASVNLTLAIQSVLLNLGHSQDLRLIRLGNSRVLSLGGFSWVLWDAATAALLATGAVNCLQRPAPSDAPCSPAPRVDIAGSILVIEKRGALEIRSAADGSLITTLSDPSFRWWKLASDGSYVSTGGAGGLTVWSPTGAVVASRIGDYSSAIAFAAPGTLRVALGPAGASVIETLSLPSGSSLTGPAFQGQFNSWFQDGARFLTSVGNTVWVYSADGATQQDLRMLPTVSGLTGQGSWFWTYNAAQITIYKVGASGSPAATFTVGSLYVPPVPYGMTIGALEDHSGGSPVTVTGVVHVIDLSGASPVMTDYTTPTYRNVAYAATSRSQWLVGNANGTLLDGTSLGGTLRYFGFGRVSSIAGSAQRVAIATAVGKILFFKVATGALEGTIDSPASQLALSADGSVLVGASTATAGVSLLVYSLPSGTLTYSWPPAANLLSFALSDSGAVLGQVLQNCTAGGVCTQTRQVTATTGGAVIWSEITNGNPLPQPIRLSPDGTLIAASSSQDATAATNIYRNGALVTAVPGWAIGWLDNTHLLVQNFNAASVIYDPSGLKLSTPTPHNFADPFQIVDPDSIYEPGSNMIFSVTTGASIFSTVTASMGVGAVAGSQVVFASGDQVLSQPF
jgi:hypothetical protein